MQTPVARTPHVRWWGLTVTILSLISIALATLVPGPPSTIAEHLCLLCGTYGGSDAILNVVLFVPLGIGLAAAGVDAKRTALTGFAVSLLVELAQLMVITGRHATTGDVVMNTFGVAVGYSVTRYAPLLLNPSRVAAWRLTAAASLFWLTAQIFANFVFTPVLPVSVYYGQIARALGRLPVFRGQVLDARLGSMPIPNTAFAASGEARRLLQSGAPVSARITSRDLPGDVAPIVRVADSEQREILLLGQQRGQLVFGIRSGAAVLRVRRPYFKLANVFANSPAATATAIIPVAVSAAYLVPIATMQARSSVAPNELHRIRVRASLAWVALLPFNRPLQGTLTESLIGWTITFLLLTPIGYWAPKTAERTSWSKQLRSRSMLAGMLLVTLATGFIAIPFWFLHAMTPPTDVLAGVLGVFAGVVVSRTRPRRPAPRA